MAPSNRPNFEPKTVEEMIQWRRDHYEAMKNDRRERHLEALATEKRVLDHLKAKFGIACAATEAIVIGYITKLVAEINEFNATAKDNKALLVADSGSPLKKNSPPRKLSGGGVISVDRKPQSAPGNGAQDKNANFIEIDPTRLRFPRFSNSPKSSDEDCKSF
ncbi:hypothetical protein L596_022564 [Steinernema carpocapsae]|uniref:Uncharacterized protein n=1 Tax=Steinernema carpocapsae TaxID=34508 RepID=A0A4U5MMX6_STECR|nr:hypothetical protein L596_022564 [Steinernema carpocapsae]